MYYDCKEGWIISGRGGGKIERSRAIFFAPPHDLYPPPEGLEGGAGGENRKGGKGGT